MEDKVQEQHVEVRSPHSEGEVKGGDLEQNIDISNLDSADGYASVEIQKETNILDTDEARLQERKHKWKLDSIILPTISALYFFEYLDRGNIAVGVLP